MADLATFWVLVVTDLPVAVSKRILQVGSKRSWSLERLLRHYKESSEPGQVLNTISLKADFYTVNNPPARIAHVGFPNIDISRASLQNDTTKYTKIPSGKVVGEIAEDLLDDHLYLVILDAPDSSASAVNKLGEKYPEFFKCLTIDVELPGRWTKNDVVLNGGIFLDDEDERKPSQISDLEQRLSKLRFYTPENDNRNLEIARTTPEFNSSYAPSTSTQDGANVEKCSEFLAFYNMLDCYIPDSAFYKEDTSSSLKATVMKSNFILPPFSSRRRSSDRLAYHEEAPWKFPLFVRCTTRSPLPRKYISKNDFCVWFRDHDLPFIVGEVVSEKNESDRDRMLLHGIALVRLVFALRAPESPEATRYPFIVAIYLTRDLIAERYIMMKVQSDSNEVFISRKNFDLTKIPDAAAFQREMYNLASVLDSIFDGEFLDSDKCCVVKGIMSDAAGMKSLHTSGAWTKPTKAVTQRQDMDPIPEESGEDGLGVFDEENVRCSLDAMDYEVDYIAFGYPHLAVVVSCRDGDIVGCLKFVKGGEKEIKILRYLAGLPSKSNHTVRPFGIWPVTGGSIIGMPAAGNYLTSVKDPDTHLWSLTMQLFEAVEFMHDHNVAHLDLKPSNILISSDDFRLTIIDFGVSVLLKSKTTKYSGRVGTEGYMAPQVGLTKFSPISADLWSVGKVVQEFCLLCRPSPSRQLLLAFSERLLDDDPSKRPSMSEVLSHDIVKTQLMAPSSLAPMAVLSMPTAVLAT